MVAAAWFGLLCSLGTCAAADHPWLAMNEQHLAAFIHEQPIGTEANIDTDPRRKDGGHKLQKHNRRELTGVIHLTAMDDLSTALNSAAAGAEIVLDDGTYTGSPFYISNSITIRAKNRGGAVLDGNFADRVIIIQQGSVVLEGLHVANGITPTALDGGGYGAGIVIYSTEKVIIKHCDIYNNKARLEYASGGYNSRGGGLYILHGDVHISYTNIFSNEGSSSSAFSVGSYTSRNSHPTVTLDHVNVHSHPAGKWVYLWYGSLTLRCSTLDTSRIYIDERDATVANGGNELVTEACSPPAPPRDPPSSPPAYMKETRLAFGPNGEHTMVCKYTISGNQFDSGNTGCTFEMATAG